MDEIKIWTIDGSDVQEVQPTNQTQSERWLEENIVSKPDLLMPGLTLVGRQTQTEGGPLDLLGVDSDGRLVLFELKRGTLSRDAVAQIVDYASYLEDMSTESLIRHIADSSGAHGIDKIDDFEEWYYESSDADNLDNLTPLRLFLVGLGVDDRTERMVNFLADKGVDISLLTFHGFEQNSKTLLARLMPVESRGESNSSQSKPRKLSFEERWALEIDKARERNALDLFNNVIEMFRENWRSSSERFGARRDLGPSFLLLTRSGSAGRRRRRAYARIDPSQGRVGVVFFRPAIELCMEEIRPLLNEIPYGTWPHHRESNPLNEPIPEIQFRVAANEWEMHKEKLADLTRAVYSAWEKAN
ncbi:MAG: endonuclease NucS [Chloroflexi bacterium]|nr:endonuclease NucS [Chloroflexota bacterium]